MNHAFNSIFKKIIYLNFCIAVSDRYSQKDMIHPKTDKHWDRTFKKFGMLNIFIYKRVE